MLYTFDQIFAADPANPERVASNGSVTIFAPGDATQAPIEIKTVDGLTIANPMQVNDAGYGPAFTHDTLDRVAWAGGGFTGFFTSYEGMKNEAVAARQAAEEAAADAQGPSDVAVDRGLQRADLPGMAARLIASEPAVIASAAEATRDAVKGLDLPSGNDARMLRPVTSPEYAVPFTDEGGYVSGGVQSDGAWNFELEPRVRGAEKTTLAPVSAARTGWAIPFADQNGYVAGGIREDGTAEFYKLRLPPSASLAIADESLGYSRSSRSRVACVGDSLTAGYFPGTTVNWTQSAYPAVLRGLVPDGVEVFNCGTSGYTVDEAALRIGALPLPLSVAGGSIPASGPVTVSTQAVIGWRPTGIERNIGGTLAGVEGTLNRKDSNTQFTFTRTNTGAVTPVPSGTVFKPDFGGHAGDTVVIMLGRNNIPGTAGADDRAEDHVVKGIERIVDWLKPQLKQVLILSTPTNSLERRGTAGYASIQEINARLAAAFPSKFLDIRSFLVHEAIYELGITPTAADVANIEADTLPASIMLDTTHYRPETAALVARLVNDFLTTRGWI